MEHPDMAIFVSVSVPSRGDGLGKMSAYAQTQPIPVMVSVPSRGDGLGKFFGILLARDIKKVSVPSRGDGLAKQTGIPTLYRLG
ncbi:MAG: hypothetical protein ACRC62_19690 [Microcoleus sp.]